MSHTQRFPSSRPRRQGAGAASAAVVLLALTACASSGSGGTPSREPVAEPGRAMASEWIAFPTDWEDADLAFVRVGEAAHRVVGEDDDGIGHICPAFAPDGARLAYGQASGDREEGWQDAALVVAEVSADGEASVLHRIELDDLDHPPCPIWSPDGRWIAFGVDVTGRGPARVADQIWVVDTETDEIRRLTEILATDIEWAPDGSQLYIAEGRVLSYSLSEDSLSVVDDRIGAFTLAVSPDGETLAVERRRVNASNRYDLELMAVDGSASQSLATDYARMHGIGPVWSPDGDSIVYQRSCLTITDHAGNERQCSEQHDVVIVTVGGGDPAAPIGTERLVPVPRTGDGDDALAWTPYSVTWSPDSAALLYLGWGERFVSSDDVELVEGLVAAPLDGGPAAILYEAATWIDVYAGFPRNDFQWWSP